MHGQQKSKLLLLLLLLLSLFSAHVQNGPGAYRPSYTMGTWTFPGVKRTGRGIDRAPGLAMKLKKK